MTVFVTGRVDAAGSRKYLRTDQPHPPDSDGRVLQQGLGGVRPGGRASQHPMSASRSSEELRESADYRPGDGKTVSEIGCMTWFYCRFDERGHLLMIVMRGLSYLLMIVMRGLRMAGMYPAMSLPSFTEISPETKGFF